MAVLPVPIIADGVSDMVDVSDWWSGDPLPETITRHPDNRVFRYDPTQNAYVPDTTHVLPVIVLYPDGTEGPVQLSFWWPGDPYPPFWLDGTRYLFDSYRGVYVRLGAEHKPARHSLATAGGVWFVFALFGAFAGPAGAGVGFVLGLVIFLATAVCMAVRGAANIADPPTRENAYPKHRRSR